MPPHGSALVTFTLETHHVGPFMDSLAIFLEDAGIRAVQLTITGNAVQGKASTANP